MYEKGRSVIGSSLMISKKDQMKACLRSTMTGLVICETRVVIAYSKCGFIQKLCIC